MRGMRVALAVVALGLAAVAWPAEMVVGKVTMPLDGALSAAVYAPDGQIVRTLKEAAPYAKGTVVELVWDGNDEAGKPAPAGTYRWKSLASQAKGVDDGWIGDMADPPYGELSEHGNNVTAVAVDAEGNIYETSGWEEAHEEIRVWTPAGKALWFRGAGGGLGIAVDDQFIYQVAARTYKAEQAVLYRFSREKGQQRHWIGTLRGPIEIDGGVTGVAVNAERLWVCGGGRVERHDKLTGALLQTITLPAPKALALDAQGHLWVAHSGDRVTEFTADGKKGREITGLQDPASLCIGGPQRHLYIAEQGAGRVLEYDLQRLARVRALFSAATPGPVRATALLWPLAGHASVAVDAQGRITVADVGNHRVMTFAPDGTLLRTRYSEMVMAPMVDVTVDPDMVLSHNLEYQVNYQPGPDYGKWTVRNNWYGNGGSAVRRKIGNRQLMYALNGKHISVFDLTNGTLRPCAVIGADKEPLYNWTDTNGDGVEQPEEVVTTPGKGNYLTLAPGVWVDGAGNFWIANWGGETVMVPLDGLDAKGNPLYSWAHRKTVISKDTSGWKADPKNLRVDPVTGDIYRLSNSAYYTVPNQWFWMGGAVVERYRADGTRLSVFPILGGQPAVVVATDSDGQYFYTGHSAGDQHWIRMYTHDGLLVTFCRMGGPSGPSGGWMDHGLSLTAFTHPRTGVHYAYAEEVYWGKAIRYRIDHLQTLVRPGEGTFDWKGE